MLGERCAVRLSDEIIVLSRGVQQYFKDTYDRETVLIPNGVTKPENKAAERITEQFGLTKDGYILFLGRLVPEKGIHYLIQAYKNLETDKKLVIAGGLSDSGTYGDDLKALADGDERIIFTGFTQGRVLEELYSNAYIYVLPSELEGMPLSLLEAMSYGNCCVVSDIAECTEVVENKAYIFRRGDVEELGKYLQMMCDDDAMVLEAKKNACAFVCNKYDWDEIVEKTLALYGGGK